MSFLERLGLLELGISSQNIFQNCVMTLTLAIGANQSTGCNGCQETEFDECFVRCLLRGTAKIGTLRPTQITQWNHWTDSPSKMGPATSLCYFELFIPWRQTSCSKYCCQGEQHRQNLRNQKPGSRPNKRRTRRRISLIESERDLTPQNKSAKFMQRGKKKTGRALINHDRTEKSCTASTSRCPIQSLRKVF